MTKKKKITKKKPKKVKKSKVLKTRNNNTMSEAAFFGWLRSRIRRLSIYWKPIQIVKQEAKVPYIGSNKRRKFSYKCAKCGNTVSDKEGNVHHKIPCGSLKNFQDLAIFAEKLFVEKDLLEFLCHNCHDLEHERLNHIKTKENGK